MSSIFGYFYGVTNASTYQKMLAGLVDRRSPALTALPATLS